MTGQTGRVLSPEQEFYAAHEGHDVGWRHEDGQLYSATCHDCNERYEAPDA